MKPAEESARVRNASVSSAESAPSPAVVALEAAAPTSAPVQNAAKLQKEKEELRRINRAWNAKAEDEKRKVRHGACSQGSMPFHMQDTLHYRWSR